MVLDFRNKNTLWASVIAETLHRLGLAIAIVCPGSRSAPLAVAFGQHPSIQAIPVLDERSAAFFALGLARRTRQPVVLVCTSGTAGANFYPAVIEAHESGVPLMVLTADRPAELLNCHAGQAIDQTRLYGVYARSQTVLAQPEPDLTLLAYLRQTMVHAWERSQFPVPGPVHLNIPFREPLAPIPEAATVALGQTFDVEQFFQAVMPRSVPILSTEGLTAQLPWQHWQGCDRGLIVAGPAVPACADTYCQAVAQLAQALGWPVLAEGLSPLRNQADLNPFLISTYDIALRNAVLAAQLQPQQVIRLGELPTSKALRQWLQSLSAHHWIIDPTDQNLDPIHASSTHIRASVEAIAHRLATVADATGEMGRSPEGVAGPQQTYLKTWLAMEQALGQTIDRTMDSIQPLRESKVAWLLSQVLPPHTPLFIANSMPVRDVEMFWRPNTLRVQPYFNRGANGIDGTLSTALGMAQGQRGVLLTGDLSLLHDTNGFLMRPQFQGHLTIVLINNAGGGIFGMLPIAAYAETFETFFATPQAVDFAPLCQVYGVEHQVIESWAQLRACLNPLPEMGIRVLEVVCDRTLDAQWRKTHLAQLAADLEAVLE